MVDRIYRVLQKNSRRNSRAAISGKMVHFILSKLKTPVVISANSAQGSWIISGHPAAPSSIPPAFPKIYVRGNFDVAEANLQHCRVEKKLLTCNCFKNYIGGLIAAKYLKVTYCSSPGAHLVRVNRSGRTALNCFSVITVVIGCIPFIKWEEMVMEVE